MFRALGIAKALANPASAIAAVAAAATVAGVGYVALRKAQETAAAFSGSWDKALAEARRAAESIQTGGGQAGRDDRSLRVQERTAAAVERIAEQVERPQEWPYHRNGGDAVDPKFGW